MAPGSLLDSLTSSRTSSHGNLSNTRARPAIPIIPIIPRKLENKRRQIPREAKHITPTDSETKEPIEWKADTPPSVNGAVLSEETGVDLKHELDTQEPESPYVKSPRQFDDAERFAFDFPPPFYPTKRLPDALPPHLSTTSNGPSDTAPSSIHPRSRTSSGIVFGGFSESTETSPVLSPAVAPEFYPQAPVPADAPQSVYHGYGHTHQLPESFHGWPGYIQYSPAYSYNMQSPYDNRISFRHPLENHAPYEPTLPALSDRLQRQHLSDEPPATPSIASHSSYEPPSHPLPYPQDGNRFGAPHSSDDYHYVHSESQGQMGAAYMADPGVFTRPMSQAQMGAACMTDPGVFTRPMEANLDDDVANDHHRLPLLGDYLLGHFNTPCFADCQLHITNTTGTFDPVEFSLHSLLIARSSKISKLLGDAELGADGTKVLRLEICDRFVTPIALEAVLRVFYGGPLMRQDTFSEGEQNLVFSGNGVLPRYHSATSALDHALAYAAAGCLVQMPPVAHRGIDIASRLLSWETIEKTLSFALEGGFSPAWTGETENAASPTHSLSIDSSKDHSPIDTPASTDETHDESNLSHPQSLPSLAPPTTGTYAPYADDLLRSALAFLVQNFPPAFLLDVSAPSQSHIDRLPPVAKPPCTKSRLSSIQFGDYPADEPTAPDAQTTTTLSSILLSLPFVLLAHVLDHLDEHARRQLLDPLVKERERRRRDVLAGKCGAGGRQEVLFHQIQTLSNSSINGA
ncbi:hypothetical protein LPUS_05663 [Lasallia pustulata]|uniref:BTB domain-containing protein n=1 Tax=Lasallia pustulata TaxID=136370 RepID=A0A1W5CZJ4_9LECA|nr:hypothetical protein LPUS_05663 [Lasallia pustulata]